MKSCAVVVQPGRVVYGDSCTAGGLRQFGRDLVVDRFFKSSQTSLGHRSTPPSPLSLAAWPVAAKVSYGPAGLVFIWPLLLDFLHFPFLWSSVLRHYFDSFEVMDEKPYTLEITMSELTLGVQSEAGNTAGRLLVWPAWSSYRSSTTVLTVVDLLFDDVFWVKQAQKDHDVFSAAYASRGLFEVFRTQRTIGENVRTYPKPANGILDSFEFTWKRTSESG